MVKKAVIHCRCSEFNSEWAQEMRCFISTVTYCFLDTFLHMYLKNITRRSTEIFHSLT
jgi:hypothetical protein